MTAVFVLGMHRCGTSLVAGLLKTLGVDFGPDSDLMPPTQFNAKGFFEHVQLNGINVEIMVKFGGDWYAPPPLAPGWEDLPQLDEIRKRAGERIQQFFGSSSLWGFKDPRTCITFPFWRKLLQDKVQVVIVGRNPIDSSRSLQDAQKILASEASDLWFRHMVAAFLGSHGLPRHVMLYEDALVNLHAELDRLASFLGITVTDQMRVEAMRFLDPNLRHFVSSDDDVAGGYGLTAKVRKAYLTIRAFVDVAKSGALEPEDQSNIERILRDIQAEG